VELVDEVVPELGVLDVDCEPTLGGGGWFKRVEPSLGGGDGGGEDEDGVRLGVSPLVVFFGAVPLLVLTLGGGAYISGAGGGGGMTRLGPFDGRYGVPSASEEGLAISI
jgi:hypothetical protein